MLYCETGGRTTRLMSDRAERLEAPGAGAGGLGVSESIWYCGVCITIGYDTPFGLSQ
jgi:hypothetical protein